MLGGMGRELDSEMLRRLQDNYRAMQDEELLRLAERPGDLTETAVEALRNEMAGRRLRVENAAPAEAGFAIEANRFDRENRFGADGPTASNDLSMIVPRAPGLQPEPAAKGLAKGTVVLTTFHDAIAAGEACDLLEAEGMEIDVRDVANAHSGSGSFYGGPPVALQVIVQQRELSHAMAILREKMGLFPQQEVEEADEPVDDGTTATLGAFGHRSDAEEVARALAEAGIWNRIVPNAEGSVESEDCYTLEVKEVDMVRAGEVVERAMNLPEG